MRVKQVENQQFPPCFLASLAPKIASLQTTQMTRDHLSIHINPAVAQARGLVNITRNPWLPFAGTEMIKIAVRNEFARVLSLMQAHRIATLTAIVELVSGLENGQYEGNLTTSVWYTAVRKAAGRRVRGWNLAHPTQFRDPQAIPWK